MSARSFRSVFMVASCAGAALGCYLVSLRVASERSALQDVETRIVMAERDIRLLETEIGTRGRLAQLERWNARVLALSAPSADQFVDGGFALARLIRPEPTIQLEAPVVLASAPANGAPPQVIGAPQSVESAARKSGSAEELLHVASLKRPERGSSSGKPEAGSDAADPKQAVGKKAGDKPERAASRTVTKPVRTARVDPLAPLPEQSAKAARDRNSDQ